jgi:hypothetical protein
MAFVAYEKGETYLNGKILFKISILCNISERRKIIFTDLHWKNNPAPIMHKDLEEN